MINFKQHLLNLVRVPIPTRVNRAVDLRMSEWTRSLPEQIFEKFKQTLVWDDFAKYPDTKQMKIAIANFHNVETSQIYLSFGSAECLRAIFDSFPNRATLQTTTYHFPMYDVYAWLNDMHVANMDTAGELVVISRPNNPTGECITKAGVVKLLTENDNRLVVIDETYIAFADDAEDILDLISEYDNLAIVRSFSKSFGAAGCRIGYVLAASTITNILEKNRPMYELAGPSMRYGLFLLENYSYVQQYCSDTKVVRSVLETWLSKHDISFLTSQGNWIHIEDTDVLRKALSEANIIAKLDVHMYDKQWIRITIGPGVETLLIPIMSQICNKEKSSEQTPSG